MFSPHRKNFHILLLISVSARAIIEVGFFSQYRYVIEPTTTEYIFMLLLHVYNYVFFGLILDNKLSHEYSNHLHKVFLKIKVLTLKA